MLSWVGDADLKAAEGDAKGDGPIANALSARRFDHVVLLNNYPAKRAEPYVAWLRKRVTAPITLRQENLSSPTNYREIYAAAVRGCEAAMAIAPAPVKLTIHLSPGTPAMQSIWVILGKTLFPATLTQSSIQRGVEEADIPFDIYADFLRGHDQKLRDGSAAEPPVSPAFVDIIHRGPAMSRLIQRAHKVAVRNVPVLIEGESGTGKELLARAIHQSSPRAARPFVAVNCGAIPNELVESQLFGHERGAFTGAIGAHVGYFEQAHGGTLFLDEVGDLPLPAQVKLLRVVQEGAVVPLNAKGSRKVDVRIVAATHRTLSEEIAGGRFREDLFYRLAVAVLKIPALRERPEDHNLLLDHALTTVNGEARNDPGFQEKKLSAGARKVLLAHPWPGNVRELVNTLRRAAIWTDGATISTEDAREALLPATSTSAQDILGRTMGGSFDLRELMDEVARHYLTRAMQEAHGNKSKATELVGFSNYQTLSNWLDKYEVEL